MAELDPNYEAFFQRWKTRLKLKDRVIAEAFMRGEALDAAGYGTLPPDASRTGLHVRVDGRGIDGQADHGALPEMVAEWQDQLDAQAVNDERAFTKRFICETVALNRHLDGDSGAMVLSAAIWIAADEPGALDALQAPGVGLTVEFTWDEHGRRRMRAAVVVG